MEKLRHRLIDRMKAYFGEDEARIRHALRVTGYAEDILQYERGADRGVVIAAAILHDIGIPEAERRHGSSAARYQEMEGPPIARELMLDAGLPEDTIEEACHIIAHHHTPGVVDTINFRVVYDADLMVNLEGDESLRERLLTESSGRVMEGKGRRDSGDD